MSEEICPTCQDVEDETADAEERNAAQCPERT